MILRKFSLLIIVFLSFILVSFTLPNKLKKKVNKQIKKTFSVEYFQLLPLSIEDSINKKLSYKIDKNNLFRIESEKKLLGYAFINKAPSKTDEFDYLILLDKNLIIAKTKILIYREDYGGEIGSKRWLKQFIGKKSSDKLKYEQDIIAISGATISAHSMTVAVNQFLQNLDILHKNKVL